MPQSSQADTLEAVRRAIEPAFPRDRTPGIGCIGAGFIMVDCHLESYRQHGLNPVAITSRSLSSAESAAARHGIGTVCRTVEELAGHPDVQVLDVAVPPDCQADVIFKVLAARSCLGPFLHKSLWAPALLRLSRLCSGVLRRECCWR